MVTTRLVWMRYHDSKLNANQMHPWWINPTLAFKFCRGSLQSIVKKLGCRDRPTATLILALECKTNMNVEQKHPRPVNKERRWSVSSKSLRSRSRWTINLKLMRKSASFEVRSATITNNGLRYTDEQAHFEVIEVEFPQKTLCERNFHEGSPVIEYFKLSPKNDKR